MKQSVGPAIIIAAVVVVVALAAFFGYKMLGSSSGASNLTPSQYTAKMSNMNNQMTGNSAGQTKGTSSGSNAEMRQKMMMHAQPDGK